MKKIIAIILTVLMIMTCFSACSDKQDVSSGANSGEEEQINLIDFSPRFSDVKKGYIVHSNNVAYSITEDEAYECADDYYLWLPKNSVVSSDKEFALYTYVTGDGFALNTNLMRSLGLEVNGSNSAFKSGTVNISKDCYLRFAVKGSLSDIKIQVPDDKYPFEGAKDIVLACGNIGEVNEYLASKGDAVNYIFVTDLHHGAFINDPDGDGLRNYDDNEKTASRLESSHKQLNTAIAYVNACPYLDFLVLGGDFINGYETTESLTYKAAKKQNPSLTVRQHVIDLLQEVLAPVKQCTKPVFVLAGNHDDNAGHSLWQTTNHPGETSLYSEFLISDLDWQNEILSEFVNVEIVQDESYSFGGKSVSKYYYHDLKKGEKTVRIICLDYDDARYPFDSKGNVTSTKGTGAAYCTAQMKWFAEVALVGDFDECILLSHAPSPHNSTDAFEKIVTAYNNRGSLNNPGFKINVSYASRTSGSINHYHHGHEHEEFIKFSSSLKYWNISTNSGGELDLISSSPDSVFKFNLTTGKQKELTRTGVER